jgi:hypothetical protein
MFKTRGNKVAGTVRYITCSQNPFEEHSSEVHLYQNNLRSNLSYPQYLVFEDAREVCLQMTQSSYFEETQYHQHPSILIDSEQKSRLLPL